MKIKIIILVVVIIAIIVISYFLFFKKPSGSSVVQPASTVTGLTQALGLGGTSSAGKTPPAVVVGTSGVVSSTTPKVGDSAYASKDGVLVFNENGSLRKKINKGLWAGTVTSNVGAVTYLKFTDGAKGRVLTSDVHS